MARQKKTSLLDRRSTGKRADAHKKQGQETAAYLLANPFLDHVLREPPQANFWDTLPDAEKRALQQTVSTDGSVSVREYVLDKGYRIVLGKSEQKTVGALMSIANEQHLPLLGQQGGIYFAGGAKTHTETVTTIGGAKSYTKSIEITTTLYEIAKHRNDGRHPSGQDISDVEKDIKTLCEKKHLIKSRVAAIPNGNGKRLDEYITTHEPLLSLVVREITESDPENADGSGEETLVSRELVFRIHTILSNLDHGGMPIPKNLSSVIKSAAGRVLYFKLREIHVALRIRNKGKNTAEQYWESDIYPDTLFSILFPDSYKHRSQQKQSLFAKAVEENKQIGLLLSVREQEGRDGRKIVFRLNGDYVTPKIPSEGFGK